MTRTESQHRVDTATAAVAAAVDALKVAQGALTAALIAHGSLVIEGGDCPVCGEADEDRLVWIGDHTLECQSCGQIYLLA